MLFRSGGGNGGGDVRRRRNSLGGGGTFNQGPANGIEADQLQQARDMADGIGPFANPGDNIDFRDLFNFGDDNGDDNAGDDNAADSDANSYDNLQNIPFAADLPELIPISRPRTRLDLTNDAPDPSSLNAPLTKRVTNPGMGVMNTGVDQGMFRFSDDDVSDAADDIDRRSLTMAGARERQRERRAARAARREPVPAPEPRTVVPLSSLATLRGPTGRVRIRSRKVRENLQNR